MNPRKPWISRTVRVSSLLFALGLLWALLAVTYPQAAHAQDAPSGRGQVNLGGPMGVSVGAYQGSLSYARTDLSFDCGDCAIPLGFSRSYNGQDAWMRSSMGFYGWRHPFDVYLTDESFLIKGQGPRAVHWGGGATTRFYPEGGGSFRSESGENDTLTEPQPGQYVLTTCSGLTYYFDSARHGRPTRIEARNGQALVLSYDGRANLTSMVDSYGRQILFSYDAEDYLTQVTDPNVTPSRTLQYSHDAAGNLTAVIDALGQTTTYSYDGNHRLTEIRDASGNTLRIVYNAGGKVASLVTDQASRHFAYDETAKQTTVTDMVSGSESQRTIYRYDDRGRVVERTRNDGIKLTLAWDADDNPVRVTDESGEVTAYTYDGKGNIASITDPLSRTVSFSYHPVYNEMTSATDALGRTTTAEYDAHGNVTRVTRPGNRVTTYEYDPKGWHVIAITEPLSRTTRYGYDAYGHNTVITDATGAVMTFAYDAAGRMLSHSDDNGHTTAYDYDAAGRVTSATDPLTRTTSLTYDASGNLQRISDAAGGVRSHRYDSLNRLLGITDEVGGGIGYGYDGVGNTLSVADARGHTVRYGYDGLNRLVSETDPVGYRTLFEYDALGQLDRWEDADGQVSTYDYDPAGQLTAEHHPGGDATYAYDADGNVVAVTTTQVIMHYAYNDADETTAVTVTLPGLGISKQVGYSYYDDGMRATMTDPDGGLTSYTYDDRGRIRTITNPAGEMVTYTWDGAGRLTRKDLGNGTYALYSYDEAGQVLSLVHHQAGGQVVESLTYDYDDLGNRASELRADGRAVTYSYDARSRLTAASYSDGTEMRYAYDLAGHRTQMKVDDVSVAYTTDAAGRLQSDGSSEYHWDKQGNLASVVGVSETITYTFDTRHRLTEVLSQAGVTTTFELYPDGRRLSRTDPDGTVTIYVYDGPNLLLELDGTGNTVARYTSGGVDDWLSMERDSTRYTYHADALGSVLGLSDAGGTLVEEYRYTPFGRTQVLDGAGQPIADSAMGNAFRFTGRQSLGLGELYDYRARIYDPATGRFLSEDPVDAARDPNRYAYVLNNPTTLVDPTGLDAANPHIWLGKGTGLSAGFLFGCSVWSGTVTNQTTGEQCSITEKCCSLGGQAGFEMGAGVKLFSGPKEGRGLAGSKWNIDLGIDMNIGSVLKAKAGLDINTETGESYTKVGLGAGGLSAEAGQSHIGNLTGEVGLKAGASLTVAGKGQYCKRSVRWCDKKEEDEPEDDPEDDECDSDTGCCRIGPGCSSDEEGESDCCFTCCDGPCDAPDCDPNLPGPPPWGPGGDHPDDNFSAASPQAVCSGSQLDRSKPYVGLLWRGFAPSAGAMINQAGEPYEPVGLTFSPELAQRLPVLVIPSGGLYGLEDLASFQTRLAAYLEQGGTVISFDQQSGSDFGALPAPAGGDRLGGYGWREDNSCFQTAFYISSYHPILTGFDKPTLDVHVDGYFDTLPDGSVEILTRMKNGQPGLVVYPYPSSGTGGWVVATTIYDDWGTTNYQGSQDALTLVRDMLSWAFEPDESLPEYSPGEPVSLPITVTNGTADPASTVELALLRPDRTVAYSQTLLMAVTAGGTVVPTLNWTLPGDAQLGIWWVEYALRDADGFVLQKRTVGRRLVVSDPSPITGPNRPFSLWITAPTEHYIGQSQAEFTFHVRNHTDIERTVELHYGLPHHTWETGDLSYGNFLDLRHDLEVGPNDTATYVYTPTIRTTDRLFSELYEGGSYRANAHFKVWRVSPAVHMDLQTDGALYYPEDTVAITVTLQNLTRAPYFLDSQVQIFDASQSLVFQADRSKTLDSEGAATIAISYTLPFTASRGYYQVVAEGFHGGARGARETTRFEVPPPKLRITPIEPAAFLPNSDNPVSFRVDNEGGGDVSSGTFGVTLHDPAGSQIWEDTQAFALLQGQAITLTFPVAFSEQFGTYALTYQVSTHGRSTSGRLDIPFSNVVELILDQNQYRAGETLGVDVRVTNSGRFQETLNTVRLEVPAAAYSQTHSLGLLSPGQVATDTHSMPLPLTLTAGSHPFTATLGLASGSQEQWASIFSVPPSKLTLSSPPGATAGQVHTVTVTNIGGEATGAVYDLNVRRSAVIQSFSGTVADIQVGSSEDITFTLPAGTVSGRYHVLGPMTDTMTGQLVTTDVPFDVSGVSASLAARTDKQVYLSTDAMTATATITSTGSPLSGAGLTLRVLPASAQEDWVTHAVGDHSPLKSGIFDMIVDGGGLRWFAGPGLALLGDGGTSFDKADDTWLNFTVDDGLAHETVYDVIVDGAGRKWLGTHGGVNVLDDGGTPFDQTDDTWQTFTTANGLVSNYVREVALDSEGRKWFGTQGGVSVLDDGGTPFDEGDDLWHSFTTTDGLVHNFVYEFVMDGAGRLWFCTKGGVSALDFGTNPLDGTGDSWQSFTTADPGVNSNYCRGVAVDGADLKWFATLGGAHVLDDGGTPFDKSDDTWQNWPSSAGFPDPDVVAIAIDGDDYKWFGSSGGGLYMLSDSGTPLETSDDEWRFFSTSDGLDHTYVLSIFVDAADYKWVFAKWLNVLDDGDTPLVKSDDTWHHFSNGDGLAYNGVSAMTTDQTGHKWFGYSDNLLHGGVSVLDDGGTPADKDDDTWQYLFVDDNLPGVKVTDVEADSANLKWITTYGGGFCMLDDSGTPFDTSDDSRHCFPSADFLNTVSVDEADLIWIGREGGGMSVLDYSGTPLYTSDDSRQFFTASEGGLANDTVLAVVTDEAGLRWIGTEGGGVSVLDDNGTPFIKTDDEWHTFTTSDGLVHPWVYAIAIDGEGRKWFGTGGGVCVLDDHGTISNRDDDNWQTFTTADGLTHNTVWNIGLAATGEKWFGTYGGGASMLDDAGTPFDKSDDLIRNFTTADGLAHDTVRDLAVDDAGYKWFATGGGGVSVLEETSQALWEGDASVDLAGITQVVTGLGTLNHSGKLYLQGVLTSTTNQIITRDNYPFYIYPADTALTLETDLPVYRPNQSITLTGEVINGAGAPLTGQELAILQDGDTIHTEGPFDVPAFSSYPYSVSAAAPDSPGTTVFEARLDGVSVQDEVQVAAPRVSAALVGPDLVGSQPFSLTVVLTNDGEVDVSVHLDFVGYAESVDMTPGTVELLPRSVRIANDTTFNAVLSGDLNQTLSHDVAFGEDAEAAFYPEALSCPGLQEIPYVLTNTGQLDVEFTTQVSVTGPLTPTYTEIDVYLPPSGTFEGALVLDLAAGDHTLHWQHPYGAGQEALAVRGTDQLTLQAVAGPSSGHQAPVTTTVTNVGCNPFSGTLAVEAQAGGEPFYSDEKPVAVALGASGVYTFALDTFGLPPATFSATLTLLDGGRNVVTTASAAGDIPGPDLHISALPVQTTLVASETVTLTFGLDNLGAAGDQANLTFTLDDLEDETQVGWLDAGETAVFSYNFFVPPDLATGELYGTYVVTGNLDSVGEMGGMVFHVEGISLTVSAEADQPLYEEGDPATVSLSVDNVGAIDTGPLEALVTFNGYTQTQSLELAPGAGVVLDFPLVASFTGEAKVFYGVFYAGTDRSIHLNTLYLRQQQPLVTLLTDKQVYQPGETVVATLVTTLTQGTLSIFAPGYDGTLAIAYDAEVSFALPAPMAQGTEAIYYTANGTGTPEDGRERRTPFDVDGPEVFVRSTSFQVVSQAAGGATSLSEAQAGTGDSVTLDLVVSADRTVDLAMESHILYPDGTPGQVASQFVHLEAVPNNHITATALLTGTQIGLHQFRYELLLDTGAEPQVLVKSSVGFDTGQAGIIRVTTDRDSYPNTGDPVEATLEIYSRSGGPAQITLTPDGAPNTGMATTLSAGYQAVTLFLNGPIPAGRRGLTATLEMGGHTAHARTRFAYGTSLADLRPGAPWVATGGTITRTLTALVSNEGQSAAPATTVSFHNGSSQIGMVTVPELDAAEQATASVVWDIQGEGGEHTLRVAVDPVTEFDTGNNEAQAAVTLPRLDTGVSVTPSRIEAGKEVAVAVRLENLQAAAELPVTATLEIRSPLGTLVHEETWTRTLAGDEELSLGTSWHSGMDAGEGSYSVLQEAWDLYGESYLNRSSFTVGPLDYKHIYLPVVLRDQ